MQQNVSAVTEDVKGLHENVLFLKELFEKIDQVEVRYDYHGTVQYTVTTMYCTAGICILGK